MIEKEHLPARIHRLRDLATGLGRELAPWQHAQHRLEPAELAVYREALLDAIHGLDKGTAVLESASAAGQGVKGCPKSRPAQWGMAGLPGG